MEPGEGAVAQGISQRRAACCGLDAEPSPGTAVGEDASPLLK